MGDLMSITGARELVVPLPSDATVRDLLESLTQMFGVAFADRVFCASGKLQHTVLIFVQGEDIKYCGGLSAQVGAGEVEIIMLPMFGGG